MMASLGKISRREFQLCEQGILRVNENGKFGFTPQIQKTSVFLMVDIQYNKDHPGGNGQEYLQESDFNRTLDKLVRNGMVEKTIDRDNTYIGLTRKGEFELLRHFLKE